MKRLSTHELVPGMVTAEDVYSYSDQLILPKGLTLTDKTITKLEFYSILSIRIEDDLNESIGKPSPGASVSEHVQNSPEFQAFKRYFDESLVGFKSSLNDIVENNAPIDTDAMLEQALSLLQTKKASFNVFTMLHSMRSYDDQTYAHSMNVALICNIFARWLLFSQEDIELATLCGMLHDIGKLVIPDFIIKKPAKLTAEEYSIIKTHPYEGYKILRSQNVNEHVCNAALMHHERCDGTGYPLGLVGNKIDKFAKIVSIADVYDAMTSARIYRGPLCPFEVIDILISEGLQKYDPGYYMTFMNNVVTTYLLNRVRLSDGREGEVVFINPNSPARPTVRVGDTFIDLFKETDLSIVEIV
ncbi:MAG: HD-GYP domain-containing protein [Lachnospiraceae bacterium]|nr:HD-GYP domain-containing protein [Lachnospiraceae bacterium]MDE7239645.1 HD-GYP domain-containing protein [Lachnospiraceae bacterium]